MLTYLLKKAPGVPLYEALYRCIRSDILSGALRPGEKLPSKRALAAHLKVSKITVEGAYDQLLEEGYLRSVEKVGYFVEKTDRPAPVQPVPPAQPEKEAGPEFRIDLTANGTNRFPFSVWSRLQREVLQDLGEDLLKPMPNQGLFSLRQAIAEHLAGFRGLRVRPENILVGAGTDFLYNLLVQLLGRDRVFAMEEPGYDKIREIYGAAGVRCLSAELDSEGVRPEALSGAQVLHISPAHHFPTGRITSVRRRRQLLQWAEEQPDRCIIEDDYDSEFRFGSHPLPTMASLDRSGKVIYMNSFSKSLAPSIRLGYMVLPDPLMKKFRDTLSFYSCTVPSFEQEVLARFLSRGFFEKHLNRMRKFYRQQRNRTAAAFEACPEFSIHEENAGLHFLVKADVRLSDRALVDTFAGAGIKIRTLGSYYHGPVPDEARHALVVNYSALRESQLTELELILKELSF